jgi:hypothetical protein
MNVLDNDVADAAAETKALAHDDTLGSDTNKRLVALNVNWGPGRIVISAGHPSTTVASVLDPKLSLGGSARTLGGSIITAAVGGGSARRGPEIKSTVNHDHTSGRVGQVPN